MRYIHVVYSIGNSIGHRSRSDFLFSSTTDPTPPYIYQQSVLIYIPNHVFLSCTCWPIIFTVYKFTGNRRYPSQKRTYETINPRFAVIIANINGLFKIIHTLQETHLKKDTQEELN